MDLQEVPQAHRDDLFPTQRPVHDDTRLRQVAVWADIMNSCPSVTHNLNRRIHYKATLSEFDEEDNEDAIKCEEDEEELSPAV